MTRGKPGPKPQRKPGVPQDLVEATTRLAERALKDLETEGLVISSTRGTPTLNPTLRAFRDLVTLLAKIGAIAPAESAPSALADLLERRKESQKRARRRRGADWNRVGIDPGLPASAAEGGHPVRVLPGGCRACSRHWVEAASAAVRGFGLHKDREPIWRATES